MRKRPSSDVKKPKDVAPTKTKNVRLESAGEVVVEHHALPPAGPPNLKIHARKPLRPVPNAAGKPSETEPENKN